MSSKRPPARPSPLLLVQAEDFTPEGATCVVLPGPGPGPAPAWPAHRPLLVPGLFPGEQAEVLLGAHPADARVLRLLRAHPARRTPPCARWAEPAVCPLLALDEPAQRTLKEQMVRRALSTAGLDLRPEMLLPLRQPPTTGYRAKGVFAVAADAAGRPTLGYYAPGSHQLRPGCDCLLHHPAIAPAAAAVERACRAAGLDAAAEGTTGGGVDDVGLRTVTVRAARQGGAWVLLTVRPATDRALLQAVAGRLLAEPGAGVGSVWASRQDGSANAVVGEAPWLLAGAAELWERIGAVPVPLTAGAFHQANPAGGDLLVAAVVEAARSAGARRALDLYCGAGAYALNLAAAGLTVTGVERAGEGIAAARRASAAAGLAVGWVEQDAAAYLAQAVATPADPATGWELVVLNPPRRGAASSLLADLARLAPPTVVYVSCNPTTLARDLALLVQQGPYALRRVQPVDLLPQTGHVETVAELALR